MRSWRCCRSRRAPVVPPRPLTTDPWWGAVKEGDFTYDSGSAPSNKSGSCRIAQAPRCARKSAASDALKIKYLVATGVRNGPNLERSPDRSHHRGRGGFRHLHKVAALSEHEKP